MEKIKKPSACKHCGRQPVLEKGPKYLPDFDFRCPICEYGTYDPYVTYWNEEDALVAWEVINAE